MPRLPTASKAPDLGDLDHRVPPVRFLSNGSYTVLITSAGTGASWFEETVITTWAGDPVEDADGFFVYVRDLDSGRCWSAGFQPTLVAPSAYRVAWEPGRFEITRDDDDVETRLEVCVAPDRPFELRRVTLRNHSPRPRRLELTSYAEIALHGAAAHAAHPAFSKLFVQTEHVPDAGALLVRRRARGEGESHPWAVHAMLGHRPDVETDRARFLGRGGSRRAPAALGAPLSGTVGNVLDPSVSLRRAVSVEPGASVETVFVLGAAPDRDGALELVEAPDVEAVFEGARRRERELLDRLGVAEEEAARLQAFAGAFLYGDPEAVPAPSPSGAAHDYWRMLGVPAGVAGGERPAAPTRPGSGRARPRVVPEGEPPGEAAPAPGVDSPESLRHFNGLGGFSGDGTEYVIRLRREGGRLRLPPQPWINVVANERFGFLVSETGAGCTWRGNSREHRLTPWSNDPVLDPPSEALYLRDEESGELWSPLPGPAPGPGEYEMRHGFGASRCRTHGHDLDQETTLFVALHDPVRIARIRLTNRSRTARRLSIFSYCRLDPGAGPRRSIRTAIEADGTVLAYRPPAADFPDAVTFAAVAAPPGAVVRATCDRLAFLGRHGSPASPAALRRGGPLDGACGDGLDACIAQQVELRLEPGVEAEVAFLLGEEDGEPAARALAARHRRPGAIEDAHATAIAFWRRLLSTVRVETPSDALDVLANGWLPYQTLACRLWARTAFYQSGGAFGFRDQLQDAAALAVLRPSLAREQILLHAAHQFVEGDVLHWWHPPDSRGIRTRFVDDLLWLPYLTAFYVRSTGDASVLDEDVPFLTARALAPGEDEAFLLPERARETADLYEHCARAIDRSLGTGAHGLPLFGTGDWNDGMNRVGRLGRGESVWMGFFLFRVLGDFLPCSERRGDAARRDRWGAHRDRLRAALEESAWDGEWYRRGWYDDGAPLGSRESDECRIDALVQAWSVLSAAAPRERAARALDAVERELVSRSDGLIRLLTPPFDRTPHDPGYIKGYVPGVRENGGQYTHAALWVVRAMAELGRNDRVAELLEMLAPIRHASTPERVERYQVEPYAVAADVYGAPPHVGRGGWTWYTGSSGWMYRVILESLLGFRLVGGDVVEIAPCVPDDWPGFRVFYRPDDATRWELRVTNPDGKARAIASATVDGRPVAVEGGVARIRLVRDGRDHRADLVLGPGGRP